MIPVPDSPARFARRPFNVPHEITRAGDLGCHRGRRSLSTLGLTRGGGDMLRVSNLSCEHQARAERLRFGHARPAPRHPARPPVAAAPPLPEPSIP